MRGAKNREKPWLKLKENVRKLASNSHCDFWAWHNSTMSRLPLSFRAVFTLSSIYPCLRKAIELSSLTFSFLPVRGSKATGKLHYLLLAFFVVLEEEAVRSFVSFARRLRFSSYSSLNYPLPPLPFRWNFSKTTFFASSHSVKRGIFLSLSLPWPPYKNISFSKSCSSSCFHDLTGSPSCVLQWRTGGKIRNSPCIQICTSMRKKESEEKHSHFPFFGQFLNTY